MNRVGKIVPPKRHILKDISLSFFPGAKIGVLGLNGSGKSTLLKIMAGIDKEIEGEAFPMAGLKIGYLPQEPKLRPEQTVREAVEGGMEEALQAQKRLEEVYAAYAEEDADFDALAAEQGQLEAIIAAAGEIAEGAHDDHFPIDVFQTGSGTSSNMNANEVIANRVSQLSGTAIGSKKPVHPNDDVNLGQSSNDIIPSALHLSVALRFAVH